MIKCFLRNLFGLLIKISIKYIIKWTTLFKNRLNFRRRIIFFCARRQQQLSAVSHLGLLRIIHEQDVAQFSDSKGPRHDAAEQEAPVNVRFHRPTWQTGAALDRVFPVTNPFLESSQGGPNDFAQSQHSTLPPIRDG